MKTVEEKAKAYDEALERAKKLQETCDSTTVVGWCEYIFQELRESKDEKIKKEIINYFAKGKEYLSLCSIGKDDILAWLEKQGEKPKPSFRERYKRIANSEWFKKTHEGMSVSDDDKWEFVKQKPWSEEDELMFISTIQGIEMTNGAAQLKIDWLKSLKERVGG